MKEKANNGLETILTLEEVAEWLKITPRQVIRYGIPYSNLSTRGKRFLASDVLAWLREKQLRGTAAIAPGCPTVNSNPEQGRKE